jgi:hypothetical protein
MKKLNPLRVVIFLLLALGVGDIVSHIASGKCLVTYLVSAKTPVPSKRNRYRLRPPAVVTYANHKFTGIEPLVQCVAKSGQAGWWLGVTPKTAEEVRDKTDVVFTLDSNKLKANFRHLHMGDIKHEYMWGETVTNPCPNGCWDIVYEFRVDRQGNLINDGIVDGHAHSHAKTYDDFIKAANRALQMKSCRPVFGPDAA